MHSIPLNDSTNNPSVEPLFQMRGGTLYVSNDATPADYFRHIQQQLEALGDKPDAQNSRLWTETINYVYTVCELALEAAGRAALDAGTGEGQS